MGWALASRAHGKGYATEALTAAVKWGDNHLAALRTGRLIQAGNEASIRMAAKLECREFARKLIGAARDRGLTSGPSASYRLQLEYRPEVTRWASAGPFDIPAGVSEIELSVGRAVDLCRLAPDELRIATDPLSVASVPLERSLDPAQCGGFSSDFMGP